MQAGSSSRRNDIGDILNENALGAMQFIGAKAMPVIFVPEQDGRYDVLAFSEVKTAVVNDRVANGAPANRVQHEVTTDNYFTEEYALKEFLSSRDAKLITFNREVSRGDLLRYYIQLNKEKRLADILFDTATNFLNFKTAAAVAWSTPATALPVADVAAAITGLIDQVNGITDGARLVGLGNKFARDKLVQTEDIKSRWISGNTKSDMSDLTNIQLAETLGLDEVHFSRIQQGGSQLWDQTKFGIYLVSEGEELQSTPRVGNQFVWEENSPQELNVTTWDSIDPEGEWIKVQTDVDEKLVLARAGHILTGVTA